MNTLFVWLISYATPALLARAALYISPKTRKPNMRGVIIMHAALIFSIILSQLFIRSYGLRFPWFPGPAFIAIYLLSLLACYVIAPKVGAFYGISALIQQLAMQSINFFLLQTFPVYIAIILIVPVFAFSHRMELNHRFLRLSLFLIWGAASTYLFSIFPNIYLLATLHALFGIVLVRTSVIYPLAKFSSN